MNSDLLETLKSEIIGFVDVMPKGNTDLIAVVGHEPSIFYAKDRHSHPHTHLPGGVVATLQTSSCII